MRLIKKYWKLMTSPGLRRSLVEIFLLFFIVIVLSAVFFSLASQELMLSNFHSGSLLRDIHVPRESIDPVFSKALSDAINEIKAETPPGEILSADFILDKISAKFKESHLNEDLSRAYLDQYKQILESGEGERLYIVSIDKETLTILAGSHIQFTKVIRNLFNRPEFLLIPVLMVILALLMARRILKPIKRLTRSAEKLVHGDWDTHIEVREHDEIGILASTLEAMRVELKGRIIEIQDTAHELAIELGEKKISLEKARALQKSFVPDYMEKGNLKIATGLMPCEEVGGDFFDLQDLGGGKIIFIFGDVEGHGVTAGFNMMTILTIFRLRAIENPIPEYLANEINDMVCRQRTDLKRQFSATALIGLIDLNAGKIKLVNAGHPNPILWRDEKHQTVEITEGNPLLGIENGYIYRSTTIDINEHDKLLIYTDGLIWCKHEDGSYFEVKRLHELLTNNTDLTPEQLAVHLTEKIKSFRKIDPKNDDDILFAIMSIEPETWSYIELPPSTKDSAVAEVIHYLEKLHVPNDIISDFRLALDELITNAIIHGNKEDPKKKVFVRYTMHQGLIKMMVKDEGIGFERDSSTFMLDRDQIYEAGKRGVYLVKSIMDEMYYNETGNEVTITKRISSLSDW
jgi:serine phosphatase RsbU (regulator of sigma subunit)/anti-sigma regulatory factor (Ser/Thr protein kinase)